jgi:nicotinamidase-related amidase
MPLVRSEMKRLLSPGSSALMVIDMQNDFVSQQGKMAEFGFEIGCVRDSLAPMRRILAISRSLAYPIIHTCMINELEQNPLSWYAFWGQPAMTIRGTWGAEQIEEMRPLPGETVLVKYTYGAFTGTNLDTILRRRKTETLIVMGTDVNICAGDTIHQAFALGYNVVAVSDCLQCFSRKGRQHAEQLRQMGMYLIENHFGSVISSTELLELMAPVQESG